MIYLLIDVKNTEDFVTERNLHRCSFNLWHYIGRTVLNQRGAQDIGELDANLGSHVCCSNVFGG